MKQLVIMPGGFHPFHAGHLALYQSALKAFPGADVKVAATNDTSARPFPFRLKEKLAQLAGVPPGDFYQVKSPFRADEITKNYDPASTQLIFVRSKKDADKPPVPGGVKKDGNPAYLQPISRNMAPMTQHAYMAYLPTVTFGPGMQSATEIRTAWPELDERRRMALVMSLYPHTQKNPKLAKTVVKMLDAAMGKELTEVLDTKAGTSHHAHWNASDPDMVKFTFTASNGVEYQLDFLEPYIGPDEMSPYDFFDSDEVYNKSKFVSFEQITKDIKGGYPVAKQGIEGTGSAAEVFGIVVNAIIQYVKKARPALLYFQAAEPNRRALYARMIRRILPGLPGWASTADDAGQFAIYNRRAIKSAMGTEVAEAFDNPYKTKTEKSEYGDVDMLAKLPDGTNLSIMFNHEGDNEWQVEFYRDNSQEVTGQGDAQRIFATVLAAIQKFVKKYQPDVIKFSAEKSNNSDSRSSLYDRLVSRFAQQLGYDDYSEEYMNSTMYELSKQSQGVDEEVTRQMSQGGLRASYQAKYNQPMMEDYLDEARS